MKIFSLLLLIALFAVAASGQAGEGKPRIVAEIAAGSHSQVKGSPFSAEAVSESVQTLADGNRIVRKWSSKLYRNSEGRFRHEGSGIGVGLGVFGKGGSTVTIHDPGAGYRYFLDTHARTARPLTVITPRAPSLPEGVKVPGAAAEKIQAELDAVRTTAEAQGAQARRAVEVMRSAVTVHGTVDCDNCARSKYDTKTEALGVQSFDGVDAEGTRTITTIPADAIGNERPIEIVYEKWFSKELQMIVYSKHSDPRFGEQTYRLTNINRSEPDPSLFELPAGYKIMSDPSTTYFRTAPTKVSTRRPTSTQIRTTTVKAVPVKNATSGGSRP